VFLPAGQRTGDQFVEESPKDQKPVVFFWKRVFFPPFRKIQQIFLSRANGKPWLKRTEIQAGLSATFLKNRSAKFGII
jgi:hypothetical protein